LNQKLIKILEESLKQGIETKSTLDSMNKGIVNIQGGLRGTSQNVANSNLVVSKVQAAIILTNKNLKVADEKTNKLAESIQALHAQNNASNQDLGALKADLKQVGEFDKLADEKSNKLIDLTTKLATHSADLESRVTGQLKESEQREEARTTKVDLANEKLSRLIEILKSIVKEQAKLDPVARAMNDLKKEQVALKKAQADFKKSQKKIELSLKNSQQEIKEALADLRRKANVNISRSDDIKKTLRRSSPAKK
jgi:chromosome segregation ATPase